MMTEKYKERLLEAVKYVFEGDEDIEVLDVFEAAGKRYAEIKVKNWPISEDDFEYEYVPADEDGKAHTEVRFTLAALRKNLPTSIYVKVMNSDKTKLEDICCFNIKGHFVGFTEHIRESLSINKSDHREFKIIFNYGPSLYNLVNLDDESIEQYLNNPPEIKHDDYGDYEILGYDTIDVIIYLEVY